MNPDPRRFIALLIFLLPAFLLPSRVELCLAGDFERDTCCRTPSQAPCDKLANTSGHESARESENQSGGETATPSGEAVPRREPAASACENACGCSAASGDMEPSADMEPSGDAGTSGGPTTSSEATAPTTSGSTLATPGGRCECCVQLCKAHSEACEGSLRKAVGLSVADAPVTVRVLPRPAPPSTRTIPHRNPSPPPLRPLRI